MRTLTSTLALVACALMTTACQDRRDDQLLSSIGYGPDRWTRARLESLGHRAYIEQQLRPPTIHDGVYDDLVEGYAALKGSYRDHLQDGIGRWEARQQLTQARILRAIHSHHQLKAVLLDFWMNHFNVFAGSGTAMEAIVSYERNHVEPHVLGRFEDLLISVAHSPAMLDYLDNDDNSRWGLNENYAREVMELHTLGVDGPYTERDVRELARILTGWTTDVEAVSDKTGFRYDESWHDHGQKWFLGRHFPAGGGKEEGVAALRMLANHPVTAEYVSSRLAIRFLGDEPAPEVVAQMTQTWLRTGGDIREVMRTLLLSPTYQISLQINDPRARRPLAVLAGLIRALDASGPQVLPRIKTELRAMGEELYMARPPTGYPEISTAWAGNSMLLRRANFFASTARQWNGIEFTRMIGKDPERTVDLWIDRLFVRPPSSETRAAALEYLSTLPGFVQHNPERISEELLMALILSPEFIGH